LARCCACICAPPKGKRRFETKRVALDPWIFAGPTSYNVGIDEEYRGAIDDIRFFRRSLDEEEINLLFDAQQP